MKKVLSKIFSCFLLISCSLFAEEGAELEDLTQLIEKTASQISFQRELKADMEKFSNLKKQFVQGKEVKKVGFQMVQVAIKILDTLQEERLQELVPKPYLEELTFFSTLAKKT